MNTKAMIHKAFTHPLRSRSRKRSPMIWNRIITKKKPQTKSQKKSQNESIARRLPFQLFPTVPSLADARLHGGARTGGAAHPRRVNLSESHGGCAHRWHWLHRRA